MHWDANTAGRSAAEIHEMLYDGADLTVSFEDGRTPKVVKVRKIPRNEIGRLAQCLSTEEAEAACYLGCDEASVAALDDQSFHAVLREGRRLNFTRLTLWLERQTEKMKAMSIDEKTVLELAPLIRKLSPGFTSS